MAKAGRAHHIRRNATFHEPSMPNRMRLGALLASLLLAFSLVAVDHADARRGGSFGSRGFRTFQSAPATRTSPFRTAPVQRSMTPRETTPQAGQPGMNMGGTYGRRRGLFGGFGGGLLGGLLAGGLFGMMMGGGFGGAGGFLAMIVQIALIGFGAMFLMRLFGRRSAPTYGSGHGGSGPASYGGQARSAYEPERPQSGSFPIPSIGARAGAGGGSGGAASPDPAGGTDEIGLTDADFEAFEQRLQEVQAAFAREDYAALRRLSTPEVMSYLAEELSENATSGRRNEVSDVKLLQGDLSEAWREGDAEYATVAMHYQSIDVMRDRQSGAIVSGDPDHATETTELWTFVRQGGGDWQLSAIQEA